MQDKNVNISAFSKSKQDLFEVIMFPLTLNTLSEGIEVAGIHKYLIYFLTSEDKKVAAQNRFSTT